MSSANRSVKGPVGWIVLLFAVVGLFAVGLSRESGPRTADERIESISERIACPVCEGESVADSRNPASDAIKESIQSYVREGVLSDDEIVEVITAPGDGRELLVPTATGIQALAWALPATAFVIAVIGLGLAFRRWRVNADALGDPTADDVALVERALADRGDDAGEPVGDDGRGDGGRL